MTRDTGPTRRTVELVWDRDGAACARCGRSLRFEERGFAWSVHHRRPRGLGGTSLAWVNLPANLVCLCGHATTPGSCHQWVENNRDDATSDGWLVSRIGVKTAAQIAVEHDLYGLVYLTDDGGHHA